MAETPTKTIERVCVSPVLKDQICLLFTNEVFKQKLTSGQKETKACFNLELIAGKEISSDETFDKNFVLKLRRLKRNCSSKDSLSESFESLRKSIETEKGGTMSVKRLARSTRRRRWWNW